MVLKWHVGFLKSQNEFTNATVVELATYPLLSKVLKKSNSQVCKRKMQKD